MNKTVASLLMSIVSGLLLYICTLAIMFLPYCNASSLIFWFGFVVLCTIGILIPSMPILYRNRSVLQSVLRWLFTLAFFVGFFLLSAHVGLVVFLEDLFNFSVYSSSENISGLLLVNYLLVVFISSFVIVLGKIATILFLRFFTNSKKRYTI